MSLEQLESRVAAIEARNRRVELDKAWEQSWLRRVIIAVLTYAVVVIYLAVINVDKPFLNAIVPSLGFYLSTLALSLVKNWWISQRSK